MDTSDRSDTQHAILKLPHDVLSRWAPVLHLHHTDYFLPVAFEFFLRNGSLRKHVEDVNNDRGVTTLLPVGQVSEELLLSETAFDFLVADIRAYSLPVHR